MNIKLFFQAITKLLLGALIIGLLIFIPANTIYYWNGWLLMGLLFIPMFIAGACGTSSHMHIGVGSISCCQR